MTAHQKRASSNLSRRERTGRGAQLDLPGGNLLASIPTVKRRLTRRFEIRILDNIEPKRVAGFDQLRLQAIDLLLEYFVGSFGKRKLKVCDGEAGSQ